MSLIDRKNVIEILKSIHDPIIPVNVWDLGLIYDLDLDHPEEIQIRMTLLSQGHPKRENLVKELESALKKRFPTQKVIVRLVFDPKWTPERMNEDAQKKLGIENA